jgi:hypothetical protein
MDKSLELQLPAIHEDCVGVIHIWQQSCAIFKGYILTVLKDSWVKFVLEKERQKEVCCVNI